MVAGSESAAEDVVQEAFARAFSRLHSFNGRSAFATWLSRIVVNCAIDVRRRDEQRRRRETQLAAPEDAHEDEPDAGVLELVEGLPAERRVVVVLRYWLDLSPAEIAELLDVPLGTVHSRLARALAQLRTHLEVKSGC